MSQRLATTYLVCHDVFASNKAVIDDIGLILRGPTHIRRTACSRKFEECRPMSAPLAFGDMRTELHAHGGMAGRENH
jgi:hypothetical protein